MYVTPDIVTLAKPIAAGLPMGMTLVGKKTTGVLQPSDHGSTFAGGPMACRAALVFLTELEEHGLQDHVETVGGHLTNALLGLAKISDAVVEIRGRGLWVGIELHEAAGPARRYCEQLLQEGVLCKETHDRVIRLAPPLVITIDEIDWAFERLEKVLTT